MPYSFHSVSHTHTHTHTHAPVLPVHSFHLSASLLESVSPSCSFDLIIQHKLSDTNLNPQNVMVFVCDQLQYVCVCVCVFVCMCVFVSVYVSVRVCVCERGRA